MSPPLLRPRFAAAAVVVALAALMSPRGASADLVNIVPGSATLLPGQSETVSVQLTVASNYTLGAADLEIAYDSTRFTVSNVALGTLDPASSFSLVSNATQPGYVLASIASGTGTVLKTGAVGTLETFTLTALSSAPIGGALGDINLLANSPFGLMTATAVYDLPGNSITLTPPPTNGYDVGVDGTVIVGAVVPEPSSWILMGLGAGLAAVTTSLRKRIRRRPAV